MSPKARTGQAICRVIIMGQSGTASGFRDVAVLADVEVREKAEASVVGVLEGCLGLGTFEEDLLGVGEAHRKCPSGGRLGVGGR